MADHEAGGGYSALVRYVSHAQLRWNALNIPMIKFWLSGAPGGVKEVLGISSAVTAGRYVLALADLSHGRRNGSLGFLQRKWVLYNSSRQPRGHMPGLS